MMQPDRPALNRRQFLEKSGWLAGAALVLPAWPARAGMDFSKLNEPVLKFVATYTPNYFLQGGGIVGKLSGSRFPIARIVAEVTSFDAMEAAWTRHPYKGVYAAGNTLAFYDDATFVTVENLLPAEYEQRSNELARGEKVTFAHEALSYDPSTSALRDVLGAATTIPGALTLVNRPTTQAASFTQFLQGTLDQSYYNLRSDRSFANFRRTLLAQSPTKRSAAEIATAFITALPALASTLSASAIRDLLAAPLVAASLSLARGVSVPGVVRAFSQMASRAAGSAGAMWLAAIAGPAIHQQNVLALKNLDTFSLLQARMALAEARTLVRNI